MKYSLTRKQFETCLTSLADWKNVNLEKYLNYLLLLKTHDNELREQIDNLELALNQCKRRVRKLKAIKRKPKQPKNLASLYRRSALTLTKFYDIERRASRASPGPWECAPGCLMIELPNGSNILASNEADAEFIANSRTDITKLCFELARNRFKLSLAKKRIKELEQQLK